MKRVLCLLLVLVGVGLGAQTSLTPAPNLLVKSDSNGYLLVTPAQSTAPFGPLTPFNTIRLRTDSNGFLMTALAVGAGIDGTVPPGVAVGSVLVSAGVGLQGLWSASPTLTSVLVGDGLVGTPSLTFASEPGLGFYRIGAQTLGVAIGGSKIVEIGLAYLAIRQDAGQLMLGAAVDVVLNRDAANVLALKNGTNAQAFRVYGNASTSKYALVSHDGTDGNISSVGTSSNLTVAAAAALFFQPGNTNTWQMTTGGGLLGRIPGGGLGYTTGAGGTVTQATSRATGVTLNTVTGDITLVSAAGSATPASFIVADSAIVATDNVTINQKSGTDLYEIFVTNVAAGSFKVTFFTTGGTTTEQPVFHFSIIKGVIS